MKNRINIIEVLRAVGDDIRDAFLGLAGIYLSSPWEKPLIIQIFVYIISFVLLFSFCSKIRDIYRLMREKHVPLIVDVGDDDSFVDTMRKNAIDSMQVNGFHYNPKVYAKQFNVDASDVSIQHEFPLNHTQEDWYRLLKSFDSHLNLLHTRLSGSRTFHIFMKCPTALAFGMGALSGSKNCVVLYHHDGNQYRKVIDCYHDPRFQQEGAHFMKSQAEKPFEYFQINQPSKQNCPLYIALDLSAHPTFKGVQLLAEEAGAAVLGIEKTYENTLDFEKSDWCQAARECATVIRKWTAKAEYKGAALFLNAPLPLSFAIGMGIGTPVPLTINHWFREENAYHPVYELNKIMA